MRGHETDYWPSPSEEEVPEIPPISLWKDDPVKSDPQLTVHLNSEKDRCVNTTLFTDYRETFRHLSHMSWKEISSNASTFSFSYDLTPDRSFRVSSPFASMSLQSNRQKCLSRLQPVRLPRPLDRRCIHPHSLRSGPLHHRRHHLRRKRPPSPPITVGLRLLSLRPRTPLSLSPLQTADVIVVSTQPLSRSLQELVSLFHSSLSDAPLRFLASPACFRQASRSSLVDVSLSPSAPFALPLQSLLFRTFHLPSCSHRNASRILVVADALDESFLAAVRELGASVELVSENNSLETLVRATAEATVVVTFGETTPLVMMTPGSTLVAFGETESVEVTGVGFVQAAMPESAEAFAQAVDDVLRSTLLD